jgi:DNA-damage-inducible protein J
MSKSEMIRARTEPKLKKEVEKIFHALGLSYTEAINLFFQQVKLQHGLPFEVKIPNAETRKAIKDTKRGKGVTICKNADDMFKKLGI